MKLMEVMQRVFAEVTENLGINHANYLYPHLKRLFHDVSGKFYIKLISGCGKVARELRGTRF